VLLTACSESPDAKPQLWVLGANGAIIDGPLLVVRADALAGGERLRVHGLTGTGTAIWLATSKGLLRFDVDRSGEGAGNHGYFITPALTSPERDTRRGWLRAELDTVLTPGSVLEARYFSTSNPQLFQTLDQALRDVSVSAERRRQLLRELLGESEQRHFVFAAAPNDPLEEELQVVRAPLAVPLFDTTDRWLWLEIALSSAPASVSTPVRELRVLYPDVSLVESLPAIYRGAKNDPGGTLRRLVGVIEATTQHLDQRIQHIHRLLNPATAPREWLDFIARWLDLPWDDSLELAIKRRLLSAAAELLGNRGTRVGLERLLSCLFGEGRVRILDVTADAGVVRLGGEGCSGVRLPALLAGASPRAAVLSEKTVLGRARLPCADSEADPLADLAARVRISIQASAELRHMLEPILTSLLAQYVPAELRLQIRWQLAVAGSDPEGTAILILDEAGPARLAEGSRLGRTTLSGKWAHRLTDPGSGLRLQL
jgi:phage tail-like protein